MVILVGSKPEANVTAAPPTGCTRKRLIWSIYLEQLIGLRNPKLLFADVRLNAYYMYMFLTLNRIFDELQIVLKNDLYKPIMTQKAHLNAFKSHSFQS